MTCSECGDEEATVRLTEIVGGKKRVRQLCKSCAEGVGFVIDLPKPKAAAAPQPPSVPSSVMGALGALGESLGTGYEDPTTSCPHCGITWGEFRKSSRLGCPHDYDHEVFGTQLDDLLTQYHGATEHKGSRPVTRSRHVEEQRAERERVAEGERLQKALAVAVATEDFEEAARLRDQLEAFERGGDHGTD